VLTNAPRFSAYVASKAALDAWTRCASSEFADTGHHLHHHQHAAGAHADDRADEDLRQRADAVARRGGRHDREACVDKPVRIATRLGIFGEVLHALVPRVAQIVMNTSFRMFPDSAAAKGDKSAKPTLSPRRWRCSR
jgi:hypothetical protein